MQLRGDWSFPTRIRFGAGRIGELAGTLQDLGKSRPLVVTDPTLAAMPMLREAVQALEAEGFSPGMFSEIRPNPVESNVRAGVRAFIEGGHDCVVAFGGGSALDVGKLIAFMHGQTRPIWDFVDVGERWKAADASAIAPVIAVPTTAGTGSEVGRAAVVTDEASGTKAVIFHPGMMPALAICDPELTRGMPRPITAGTGMDAFAHCLEAYCATGFHPLADGVALEGMRLLKDHLPRAYRDGNDLEARACVMAAATMGATAFQKGLGAVHALSHPIGALHDTHHGLTNAVLLPYVLVFNRPAVEQKIERLALQLGLTAGFAGWLDWLLELRAELGVPHTLQALGVDEHSADRIARMAAEDPTAPGNPVPLDAAAARRIFAAAFEGRV